MAVTVPVFRVEVTMLARPAPFRFTVSLTPGPVKVTVPPGVPPPGAITATEAVSVTGVPAVDGSGLAITVVMVSAGLTVTETVSVEGV
ncbi:hypothetical protein D3C76_1059320 [compost metagenome]